MIVMKINFWLVDWEMLCLIKTINVSLEVNKIIRFINAIVKFSLNIVR